MNIRHTKVLVIQQVCMQHEYFCLNICNGSSEKSSKSHIKSSVFQHIFNYISTYAYACPEYLLHNFNNTSTKFYVIL